MGMRKRVTRFLYWTFTRSPLAHLIAAIFRSAIYDGKGLLSLPENAPPDVASAIFFRVYERPERLMVRRWLPQQVDCIELGASLGVVSREILQTIESNQTYVGVEASPELAPFARKNIEALKKQTHAIVVNKAISYSSTGLRFETGGDHLGGRVVSSGDSSDNLIATTTLQDVLSSNKIQSFSLVMDIEGMEYELLDKESESLAGCVCIIAELHGSDQKKAWFQQELKSVGFSLVDSKHNVVVFVRGEIEETVVAK